MKNIFQLQLHYHVPTIYMYILSHKFHEEDYDNILSAELCVSPEITNVSNFKVGKAVSISEKYMYY